MAATARLTGKLGSVYLNAVKVLDIYNWQYEINAEALPCSIKGDVFERYVVGVGTGRIRAERYITTFAGMTATIMADTIANGAQTVVILYLIDANNSFSKLTATGYITRGEVAAPHAKATDQIEITLDGIPTYSGV